MDSGERILRARLGAYALHSRYNSRVTSQPARDKFMSRFAREVLEHAAARGEALTPEEVERRAEHAKKLYFTRLSLKSAQARRKGAEA